MAAKKPGKRSRSGRPPRSTSGIDFIGKSICTEAPRGAYWVYGSHAARAALTNKRRRVRKVVATSRAWAEVANILPPDLDIEPADHEAIAKLLPPGAVHQGLAVLCDPLPTTNLQQALEKAPSGRRIVAVLDQITDPQNEGAILRSAAAFGVSAVIVQDRHAPPEGGTLAKAASGALEIVPRVAVVNIARTLDALGRMNFWRIALAGDAEAPLRNALRAGDIAIVLGAEGAGVRRLVRENCDVVAAIPINDAVQSLNVSNAAAIALYELRNAT